MVTRGPPDWVTPLATMLVPPKPVSEEPIESVITRLGSNSQNRSLRLGENSAAVLDSRNSAERSYSPDSSASSNGRPMASPVKNSRFTLCFSTVRHTCSASNSGASTLVCPANSAIQVADWVAPWIIGGIANRTIGGAATAWRACSYSSATNSPVAKSVPPRSTR